MTQLRIRSLEGQGNSSDSQVPVLLFFQNPCLNFKKEGKKEKKKAGVMAYACDFNFGEAEIGRPLGLTEQQIQLTWQVPGQREKLS